MALWKLQSIIFWNKNKQSSAFEMCFLGSFTGLRKTKIRRYPSFLTRHFDHSWWKGIKWSWKHGAPKACAHLLITLYTFWKLLAHPTCRFSSLLFLLGFAWTTTIFSMAEQDLAKVPNALRCVLCTCLNFHFRYFHSREHEISGNLPNTPMGVFFILLWF